MVGVNAVANGMESGITYVGPAYIADFEYGIPCGLDSGRRPRVSD